MGALGSFEASAICCERTPQRHDGLFPPEVSALSTHVQGEVRRNWGEMALELAQDLFWGRDRLIRNEFVLMKRFVCRR